jgi:hypothetical protein
VEPKEKNTLMWYEWALRERCRFNPVFFRRAIERGIDLAVLRNYLDALENKGTGDEFSAALMKGYGFNTMSLKVAFDYMLDLEILRKYIDYLEAKISGDREKPSISTKSYVTLLALISILTFNASDAMACHHPPITMACYRPKTICYGFVPHIFKERKDGRWHYYIKKVLTELPCPRK